MTWPECSPEICPDKLRGKHWCSTVANRLRDNDDLVHIDGPICVPYLPAADLFVECKIGDEVNPEKMPGVHRLYVIKNVPLVPAPHNREEIELALWTQGEGRASICLTVRDWVRGLAGMGHVPCTFVRHSYRENVKSQSFNQAQWEINDFYCATESACWFCYNGNLKASGSQPDNLIDPLDEPKAQNDIRQRLRNR
jgi:hypothetical protein